MLNASQRHVDKSIAFINEQSALRVPSNNSVRGPFSVGLFQLQSAASMQRFMHFFFLQKSVKS